MHDDAGVVVARSSVAVPEEDLDPARVGTAIVVDVGLPVAAWDIGAITRQGGVAGDAGDNLRPQRGAVARGGVGYGRAGATSPRHAGAGKGERARDNARAPGHAQCAHHWTCLLVSLFSLPVGSG